MDAFPVNDSSVIRNHSSNGTEVGQPNWTYVPVLSSIITVAGIITNGPVLLVIVKNHSTLLTPFNIYLVNLLIGNLLNLFLFFPLNVIHLAYGDHWWLGFSACTLYLYGLLVLNASMGHCHLLITVNRLWAVSFPISYRNRHRKSVAILICLAMWVYLHVTLLPGVIMDAVYYRLPVETSGCSFNAEATNSQSHWVAFVQIQGYDLPIVFIAVSYVWIAYRRVKRLLDKSKRVQQIPTAGTLSSGRKVSAPVKKQIQTVTKNNTDGTDNLISNAVEPSTSKTSPPMSNEKKSRFRCPSIPVCGQRFLVLTLMTLVILVCHTPEQVQDTMWFITRNDFGMGGTLVLLMAIPTVLDPLLFAITLTDLRQALLKFLRRH